MATKKTNISGKLQYKPKATNERPCFLTTKFYYGIFLSIIAQETNRKSRIHEFSKVVKKVLQLENTSEKQRITEDTAFVFSKETLDQFKDSMLNVEGWDQFKEDLAKLKTTEAATIESRPYVEISHEFITKYEAKVPKDDTSAYYDLFFDEKENRYLMAFYLPEKYDALHPEVKVIGNKQTRARFVFHEQSYKFKDLNDERSFKPIVTCCLEPLIICVDFPKRVKKEDHFGCIEDVEGRYLENTAVEFMVDAYPEENITKKQKFVKINPRNKNQNQTFE